MKTGAFFQYRLGPEDLVHVIFREIDIFGPLPRHAFSMKSSLIPGFGSVSFSENCDLLTNDIPLGKKNDFWLFALYNDDPCPRKAAFFPSSIACLKTDPIFSFFLAINLWDSWIFSAARMNTDFCEKITEFPHIGKVLLLGFLDFFSCQASMIAVLKSRP